MNIYNIIKNELMENIKNNFLDIDKDFLTNITCEPPKNSNYGDMSTNAALILGKINKTNPLDLAIKISSYLEGSNLIDKVDVVKPGFLNITLKQKVWNNILSNVLKMPKTYGFSNHGKNKKINIEYVSANPTGPIHIGHARGAIFGDVLANLLSKNGYIVDKEYYINDQGKQIKALAYSVRHRILNSKDSKSVKMEDGMYPGEYLVPVAEKVRKKLGNKISNLEVDWLKECSQISVDNIMNSIKYDLKKLGVEHNKYISEMDLYNEGLVDKVFSKLNKSGFIYQGTLEKPKGKPSKDWKETKQTLFKATLFDDNSDRVIKKSDGSWTYFAADSAYHYHKLMRGYDEIINIWGADHGGYIKRIEAVIKALKVSKAKISVKLCQMVNLSESGKPVKMSKRSGDFISLKDVLDKVGKDILRFIMLTRKNDAHLDFDLDKVVEQSKDNPVFYVQYAHARICSVKKIAKEKGIVFDSLKELNFNLLKEKKEISIIKLISQWPRTIESSIEFKEPHRIVYYLQELSSELHSYWSLGKTDQSFRVIISEDIHLTHARIALLEAVRIVISLGLGIIGVKALEEM